MGEQPTHRIIRKNPDVKKWDVIGAGWEKDTGAISVVIEPVRGGEKIKGLLVKNDMKKSDPKPTDLSGADLEPPQLDDSIPF